MDGSRSATESGRRGPDLERWWLVVRHEPGALISVLVILVVGVVCSALLGTSSKTVLVAGITALAVAVAVTVPASVAAHRRSLDELEATLRRQWAELGLGLASNANRGALLQAVVTTSTLIPTHAVRSVQASGRHVSSAQLLLAAEMFWTSRDVVGHPFVDASSKATTDLVKRRDELKKVLIRAQPLTAQSLLYAMDRAFVASMAVTREVRNSSL